MSGVGGGGGGAKIRVKVGALSAINYLNPTLELNNEKEILNLVINALHIKLLDFENMWGFFFAIHLQVR